MINAYMRLMPNLREPIFLSEAKLKIQCRLKVFYKEFVI